MGMVLKSGLKAVCFVLAIIAIKEGGPVVYDRLSQIQMDFHTSITDHQQFAVECYYTPNRKVECFDYLRRPYEFGVCAADSAEMYKKVEDPS